MRQEGGGDKEAFRPRLSRKKLEVALSRISPHLHGMNFRLLTACWLGSLALAVAQVPQAPPKPLTRNVEPGLEQAVKWKWQVAPAEGETWGDGSMVPPVEEAPEPTATPEATATPVPGGTYEVKSGDRLVFIARKHSITVEQLKGFNQLTSDLIRIGQVLNIPTREQAIAIAPFPVERKAATKVVDKEVEKTETLLLQIYLDRENFSAGAIDGKPSPLFERVIALYLAVHPEIPDRQSLLRKAAETVGEIYGSYTLKPLDFQFIVPPRAKRGDLTPSADPSETPKPRGSVDFDDLVEAPRLAYKGPWEFVAERFHCSEEFLRSINDEITSVPQIGTVLRVPRVQPFAIESALAQPLQPSPDLQLPVAAAVEDLSIFQIYDAGKLVAVMPIHSARPGLRGRGTWTILNAIARPTLTTQQESTAAPTPPPLQFGRPEPTPTPVPTPTPAPQTLASGPNNPVGIVWINLAKSGGDEPLPYGLHGTSIPDQMKQLDSIGGFRMSNYNIARAVRMLPVGTPLEWRQAGSPPIAPGSTPAQPATPAVVPPGATPPTL